MIVRLALWARPILEWPLIQTVRRNHGLEHATIHLLSRKIRGLKMSGRSSAFGFILIGDAPTDQIESSVRDALSRMKKGEHGLAVHPNCGTNLVTTGVLATLAAYLGLGLRRERIFGSRFGGVMGMMVLAFLVGQPLGMSIQRHFTTDGDPGDLELVSVTRREVMLPVLARRLVIHDVVTRSAANGMVTNTVASAVNGADGNHA